MMKVLIIEDQLPVAHQIVNYLRPHSSEIIVAENLAQAMECLASHEPFDLITVDLGLPDSPVEQARDAITKIKETQKGTLMIVITGISDPGLEQLAKESGADAFFTKQDVVFTERAFSKAIREVFSRALKQPDKYLRSVDVMEETLMRIAAKYDK